MPGWNDHVREVRESAMVWNKIWVEAGCPEAGVVFDLRKQTKKAYKYAVRNVKRRQKHIVSEKLSNALLSANNSLFWKEVMKMKSRSKQCNSPVVDGFSNDKEISECFRSKLSGILNYSDTTHRNVLLDKVASQITVSDIEEVDISVELVEHCLKDLGRNKSDGSNLLSNHFVLAASVIAPSLATFFTAVLRHGYIPSALRDCVLVPISKPLNRISDIFSNFISRALASKSTLTSRGYDFIRSTTHRGTKI